MNSDRYDGHPATQCRATEPGHYAWMESLSGDALKRAVRKILGKFCGNFLVMDLDSFGYGNTRIGS